MSEELFKEKFFTKHNVENKQLKENEQLRKEMNNSEKIT